MLQTVDVGERSMGAYRGVAPDETLDALVEVAKDLRGLRVLHINATSYGGGVSELLRSVVPLLNNLGLVAHWKVISGDDAFFDVTKAMHNGLQGGGRALTNEQEAIFRASSERNAAAFEEAYDVIVVHDPQPAALLAYHGKGDARWVWRCHIDTSQPNPQVWAFLRPFLRDYDAAVFTMREFVPPDFPVPRVEIIPPAIDPLSPKNFALPGSLARQILSWIGVSLDRPLVTQVARFDPWKDPLGVIAAVRRAREAYPNLQLALVGSMALDDPEGWEVYHQIQDAAQADPLVHVFTNYTGVGNIEVNAFQSLSDVVVQKSIREGFGLVVSEALWKGTPVVAGRAGGIPLQMADGVGGILVDSTDVDACADAIVALLRDPARAGALGRTGRARVREQFLLPRLILNELELLRALVGGRVAAPAPPVERDPVCGMVLEPGASHLMATYQGRPYVFCSERCRADFSAHPERYAAPAV